jgi:hypothetical protein
MRLNDEYKFREDSCNFNIELEPYTTKYKDLKDDLKTIDIDSKFYSRRLTFLDECDTIYTEYWKEELEPKDSIVDSISDSISDSLVLSCNVVIEIFENTTKINTIKILEEL